MIQVRTGKTQRAFAFGQRDPGVMSQLFAALGADGILVRDEDFQVHGVFPRLVFPSRRNRKTHRAFIARIAGEILDPLSLIGFHFLRERVGSRHFQLSQ